MWLSRSTNSYFINIELPVPLAELYYGTIGVSEGRMWPVDLVLENRDVALNLFTHLSQDLFLNHLQTFHTSVERNRDVENNGLVIDRCNRIQYDESRKA